MNGGMKISLLNQKFIYKKNLNINLVSQKWLILFLKKIIILNIATKFAKKISNIIQKDLVYLGLEKKEFSFLQTNFNGFIMTVSYFCFSLPNLAH